MKPNVRRICFASGIRDGWLSWARRTTPALLLVAAIGGAAAGEVGEIGTSLPNVRRGMPGAVARSLRMGFELARRRMAERPACRQLFTALGAEPEEVMRRALFYSASKEQERGGCLTGAVALTTVGAQLTFLCREFGAVSSRDAAIVIVHEALHQAGLPESPLVAGALTNAEITYLVTARCF